MIFGKNKIQVEPEKEIKVKGEITSNVKGIKELIAPRWN